MFFFYFAQIFLFPCSFALSHLHAFPFCGALPLDRMSECRMRAHARMHLHHQMQMALFRISFFFHWVSRQMSFHFVYCLHKWPKPCEWDATRRMLNGRVCAQVGNSAICFFSRSFSFDLSVTHIWIVKCFSIPPSLSLSPSLTRWYSGTRQICSRGGHPHSFDLNKKTFQFDLSTFIRFPQQTHSGCARKWHQIA